MRKITIFAVIAIFAIIAAFYACQKDEAIKLTGTNNNKETITDLINKVETSYMEGDEKIESIIENGDTLKKKEFRAPDEYLKTIQMLTEKVHMPKLKSTYSTIGKRVGVIQEYHKSCGRYDLLEIHMDCEDHKNRNSQGGWIGNITLDRNVTLRFCLVPKELFKASRYYQYAVLSMDYGYEDLIERYFDNEDNSNSNWAKLNGVSQSNNDLHNKLGSGIEIGRNTTLKLHVYDQNIYSGITSFPYLGINYGVFGYFSNNAKGWIYLDDEDNNNANKMWYEYYYIPRSDNEWYAMHIHNIIDVGDGKNTKMYVTKVR